jgi:hypothetical protein
MIFNMAEDEWDAVIAVHLKGHFTITRFATMVFRQQRSGRIVNTSSESGMGNMGQANYSAAKEASPDAHLALTSAAMVSPRTPSASRGTRLTTPELRAAGGAPSPGRCSSDAPVSQNALAPEIAPLVVYLCTDAADNVNGRDFLSVATKSALHARRQGAPDLPEGG